LWDDPTTMQGRLLQRCREILPSATASMVSGLLYKIPINLGAYQYIYLPPNGTSLAISASPPSFLKGLPEFSSPGVTKPDGVYIPQCQNAAFDPLANIVDALDGPIAGGGVNEHGDANLHGGPFMAFKGKTTTYDYAVFTPSSGRNNFLGCLSFFEHISANGTFSGIN